jgi:hypothetical protein
MLKMEIFNEVISFTMVIFLQFFLGTIYNPDESIVLGRYCCCTIFLYIGVHMGFMFVGMAKNAYISAKTFFAKRCCAPKQIATEEV